ncbi:MAG TPA: hypothetical protein VGD42_06715 [Lysobacter sp.]
MNRIDAHAALRAAFAMGARIQAWHLDECARNSAQGRWDTLPTDREPAFSCPAHLYRVHPDDVSLLAAD